MNRIQNESDIEEGEISEPHSPLQNDENQLG
jgi:hypothetical protein